MASELGQQLLVFGESATPAAQSVTVPTGATHAAFFWQRYTGGVPGELLSLSSTFGDFSGNVTQQTGSGDYDSIGVAWCTVTATGSRTITPVWNIHAGGGMNAWIVFVDGVDASSPVIDADYQSPGASGNAQFDLTTNAEALVYAQDSSYGSVPSNPASGWTSRNTQNLAGLGVRWRRADAPGASTTQIRSESSAYSGVVGIAFRNASGSSGVTGTLAATESGPDTAAASGKVLVQGSLASSESGSDTAAISGAVRVAGALAANETGSDTAALSGGVRVQGALSTSETGSDTFAATGSLSGGVTGTLNASETGSDTFSASGGVPVSGSLTTSETGADIAALSGAVLVQGALSVTESGSDAFSAIGSTSIRTGTLNAVEVGSDTALILGPSSEGSNLTKAAPGLTPKIWPGLTVRYEGKPKQRIDRLEEDERERIEAIAEQAVIEAANERTKKAMRASLQASMKAAEIEMAAASYLRLVEQAAALRIEQIEEEDAAVVLFLM